MILDNFPLNLLQKMTASRTDTLDFRNLNRQSSDDAFKRDVEDFKEYVPVEKFDG